MEFEQQYKDRGFAVLGVSMDEGGWDDVKPYIEQHKINYRVLLGNDQVGRSVRQRGLSAHHLLIDRGAASPLTRRYRKRKEWI